MRAALAAVVIFAAMAPATAEADGAVDLPPFQVEGGPDDVSFPGWRQSVGREEIERSGAADVVDLLEREMGVYFKDFGGNNARAEIDLRGGGENSGARVLVLVDGRPLNRPDLGGTSWTGLPLEEIESVEVLKGPATAKYGDNATGGVIRITTRDAAAGRGYVSGTVGGYGYEELSVGKAFSSGNWSFDALGSRKRNEGYRDNALFREVSASLGASRNWGDATGLDLDLNIAESYLQFPGGLFSIGFPDEPRESLATLSEGEQTEAALSVDLRHRVGRLEISATADAGLQDRETDLEGSFWDDQLWTHRFGVGASRAFDKWEIEGGVDAKIEQLDFERFASRDRDTRVGTAELRRRSLSGYASASRELGDATTLSFAARAGRLSIDAENRGALIGGYQDDNGYTEEAVSVGLEREFAEGVRLWTRLDRFYRFPLVDEVAAYQGFPLSRPFNAGLEPERGWGIEGGVNLDRGPLEAGLTLFTQRVDNRIQYDFLRNLNVNVGEVERQGGEASLKWTLDRTRLGLSYTYVEARYASGAYAGNELYLVPRHRLSLFLRRELTDDLSLGATVRHVSEAFEGNDFANTAEKLPSHEVLDLTLRWRPKDWLYVFVSLDNALDEQYATVKFAGLWYPEPGRSFRIGFRAEF